MTQRIRITLSRLLLCSTALILLAAGCVGNIGDPGEGLERGDTDRPFAPPEPTIHRLSAVQLQNAYRALFGEPLDVPTDLPQDDHLYGFTSISSTYSTIAPLDAEKYEAAAYAVLDQVWSDAARRDELVGCAPSAISDPCVRDFISSFGLKAWRRPLTTNEVDALVSLGGGIESALGNTADALRFTAAAILQSPHFVFRVELGTPDEETGLLRYTSWEMASRLAFVLTDAPPDQQLLDAAASGALEDAATVKVQAALLLGRPGARPALVRFFRDFMNIGRLDQLDKSFEAFPMFSATLGPSMRLEIERLFENVVFEQEGDFRSLFTTRDTFVNEELAQIYGIDGISGSELVPVSLPDDGRRGGLLTTPGFLAMNANKLVTSPTHRGRFVRISLMCQDVPPPPPGVDTALPTPDPNAAPQTLRQRLAAHSEDPACSSCHERMDPIGFAFESFDALGAWRGTDNGLPVDTATELDGTPVQDGVALGELIATLPDVGSCIARRFYQHANGRLDGSGERAKVEELVEQFVAADYNFQRLVIDLVVNDGFRYASPIDLDAVGEGTP